MVRMVRLIEDLLAGIVNPSPGAEAARGAWLRSHPALGGLALLAVLSGVAPAAACAAIGMLVGGW